MHGSTGAPLGGGGRTPGKWSRTKVYNVITKPSSSEIQNVFLSSPYDPIIKGPQWIAIYRPGNQNWITMHRLAPPPNAGK